jgi:hydroxyacylglutathione hydrolase
LRKHGTAEAEQRRLDKMFLKRFRLKGTAHASGALERIKEEELRTRSASGATVIDIRSVTQFAEGHFPGSLNIGLANRIFATCVGHFLPKQRQILVVVDKPDEANRTQAELACAGFNKVLGFMEAADLTVVHQTTQLSVFDLNSTLSRGGKPAILDVRTPGEWKSSGISGSRNIPLAHLAARVLELSFSDPLVVVCQDGYQSAVAASWLQANGFDSIQQLCGGIDAYTGSPFKEGVDASSFCSAQSGPAAFRL